MVVSMAWTDHSLLLYKQRGDVGSHSLLADGRENFPCYVLWTGGSETTFKSVVGGRLSFSYGKYERYRSVQMDLKRILLNDFINIFGFTNIFSSYFFPKLCIEISTLTNSKTNNNINTIQTIFACLLWFKKIFFCKNKSLGF